MGRWEISTESQASASKVTFTNIADGSLSKVIFCNDGHAKSVSVLFRSKGAFDNYKQAVLATKCIINDNTLALCSSQDDSNLTMMALLNMAIKLDAETERLKGAFASYMGLIGLIPQNTFMHNNWVVVSDLGNYSARFVSTSIDPIEPISLYISTNTGEPPVLTFEAFFPSEVPPYSADVYRIQFSGTKAFEYAPTVLMTLQAMNGHHLEIAGDVMALIKLELNRKQRLESVNRDAAGIASPASTAPNSATFPPGSDVHRNATACFRDIDLETGHFPWYD